MKFEEYRIADGIKTSISKLGYKKPTDIQYKSIPAVLKGEDVLAIAQTGTGKTAAFAIPILHVLQERKSAKLRPDGVKCLVMAPTHELALQIEDVFKTLGKHTRVNTLCIHGGVDQAPQIKQLQKGVDVLVATPGRMFDLVSQGALKLSRIEILVLDEADHMLDLGFIKDIRDLMRHLPKRRQTLFFSATINPEIKKLAYSLVTNAIRIQISPKNPVAKNIEHAVAFVEMDHKRFFLENMINNDPEKKMLVFVRTKVRAERVKKALERVKLVADTIHSDKLQSEREQTMRRFRKGELKVLIATDVSARGIDVPNVEYVINYDLPESSENYVHRVGRTGRGREKGQAVSFCSTEEKDQLTEIEEALGKRIQRIEISKGEYQLILDTTEDTSDNWKQLMREAESSKDNRRKKKKK
ncbi:RNA helicase [Roseivirga sp. 4D4]|uniref:DEAD/DEAH box helicase n=1 Tax=Roseivirga sp. 4D4 TaxID=1889784 RepID=UPI000852A3AA|nr:DEAD/DEAH box helicase [Roseivirga sp. 4D4]OEK00744.1 RNA helicase [Roseivirga sp. 4D4]